jgi:serine/threonine protein kinase
MSENSKIERIIDDFDEAWYRGERPSIDEYLETVSKQSRLQLLNSLLPIEIEYRLNAGEEVSADDYEKYDPSARHLAASLISKSSSIKSQTIGPQLDADAAIPVSHSSRQIGPYKLLEQIGEGGMGSVWMAEQNEPVRRQVALKLIKASLSSKEVIARFEAERQALAMMDHPNIAKVLDAGNTDTGSPFFVMELIDGTPLNEYCDKQELSIRERLEIMADVCGAIQHAHQKGILHRDLKPSNVLVGEFDGKPVPKVIDFGLAKATEHTTRLTDKTMFTELGQVVGTLQYMSPEQAGLDSIDIDTRTDIYSLGVMLYELLAGSTPLDQETMGKNALLHVLEMIREKEPPRPSTRLSSTKNKSEDISRLRRIAPTKLQSILKGELDWIVMKAIEKDRKRRYESAAGFAEDIRRFLTNEPVVARPPSSIYRLQKFIQKNRGFFYSICAVATVLVAGVIVSAWFAIEASNRNRELTAANARERELTEQQTKLTAKSNQSLQKSIEAIRNFYLEFGNAKFLNDTERSNKFKNEMLDKGIKYLKEFTSENRDNDDLRFELGKAFSSLAVLNTRKRDIQNAKLYADKAIDVFRELNETNSEEIEVRIELAMRLIQQAEITNALEGYDRAEPIFNEAIELSKKFPATALKGDVAIDGDAAICHFMAKIVKSRKFFDTGQQKLAIANAESALAELESYSENFKGDAVVQFSMAKAANWVGVLNNRNENLIGAKFCYEKCRDYAKIAYEIDDQDDHLAYVTYGIGNLLPVMIALKQQEMMDVDSEEIISLQRQNVEAFKTLAARNPGNFGRQFEYIKAVMNTSMILMPERHEEAQKCIDQANDLLDKQFLLRTIDADPENWIILADTRGTNIGHQAGYWNKVGDYEKQYNEIEERIELDKKIISLKPEDIAPRMVLYAFLKEHVGLFVESGQLKRAQRLTAYMLNFEREQLSETDQIEEMATSLLNTLNRMNAINPEMDRSDDFQLSVSQAIAFYRNKAKSLEDSSKANLRELVDKIERFH